jgi:Zn-finger nucleic acid-binding protein
MADAPTCPRCGAAMTPKALEGHNAQPIAIDLCLGCQAFWFDARESLRLSPASTLALFRLIGEAAERAPAASGASGLRCPRCRMALRLTKDMQRATRFEYWNCPRGHGRLTTFFNFLREKDFIRPLTTQQVAELRQSVQSVNCSNCGAPVNINVGAACSHCHSPLSMIDVSQAEKLVNELRQADRARLDAVDPGLALELERTRRQGHSVFDALERDRSWFDNVSRQGLVGAGLGAIARWLSK